MNVGKQRKTRKPHARCVRDAWAWMDAQGRKPLPTTRDHKLVHALYVTARRIGWRRTKRALQRTYLGLTQQ